MIRKQGTAVSIVMGTGWGLMRYWQDRVIFEGPAFGSIHSFADGVPPYWRSPLASSNRKNNTKFRMSPQGGGFRRFYPAVWLSQNLTPHNQTDNVKPAWDDAMKIREADARIVS